MARTHYEVLGVSEDADQDVLVAVYRRLIRKHHPDIAGPSGAERTSEINHAWSVLGDPDARAAYDADLRHERRIREEAGRPVSDRFREESAARGADEDYRRSPDDPGPPRRPVDVPSPDDPIIASGSWGSGPSPAQPFDEPEPPLRFADFWGSITTRSKLVAGLAGLVLVSVAMFAKAPIETELSLGPPDVLEQLQLILYSASFVAAVVLSLLPGFWLGPGASAFAVGALSIIPAALAYSSEADGQMIFAACAYAVLATAGTFAARLGVVTFQSILYQLARDRIGRASRRRAARSASRR